MRAQDMLIPVARLAPGPSTASAPATGPRISVNAEATIFESLQRVATGVEQAVSKQWLAIAPVHRQNMTLLALVTATIALLVAFCFPRYTTWIFSAALGTGLLLVAGYALLQVYAPQYQAFIPARPAAQWGVMAALTVVGMILQRVLFWPTKRRVKQAPTAQPAAA
jgi:hypothetical protein